MNKEKIKELYKTYMVLRDEAFGLRNGKTNPIRLFFHAFKTKDYDSLVTRLEKLTQQLKDFQESMAVDESSNDLDAFLEVFSVAIDGFTGLMIVKAQEVSNQKLTDRSTYFEYLRKYNVVHQLVQGAYQSDFKSVN